MDIVFRNGNVVDPCSGKEFAADVGIKDGKIHIIGSSVPAGRKEIDVTGKIIAPGFIDIHTHGDSNHLDKPWCFETALYMLKMGVTTIVGGNCGISIPDVEEYFDYIDKHGHPTNYLGFIGHRTLREKAGHDDLYTECSKDEIEKMKEYLRTQLDKGALGVSFGLEYSPGASFEEVVEVIKVLRDYPNSFFSMHFRYDADRAYEGVEEMIQLCRESGVSLQISHINSGICYGRAEECLKLVEKAIADGLDVAADCYPYNAFATKIGSAVFDEGCLARWGVDYDALLVAEGKYEGKRCTPEIFKDLRRNYPDTYIIAFVMNQDEVVRCLKKPFVMIGSDGCIRNGKGHPRGAGTFPRVLGRLVRMEGELDLMEGIKKMTSMPAKRLSLTNKGKMQEGADADIVVFDYNNVLDRATFEKPSDSPIGIEYVLVNGRVAVEKGEIVQPNSGKALRR